VRFGFVETEKAKYPVALMCRVLGVSFDGLVDPLELLGIVGI
jgi:hypothetical protein